MKPRYTAYCNQDIFLGQIGKYDIYNVDGHGERFAVRYGNGESSECAIVACWFDRRLQRIVDKAEQHGVPMAVVRNALDMLNGNDDPSVSPNARAG